MTVTPASVRTAEDLEPTLRVFAKEPDGGLIVAPSPFHTTNQVLLLALASELRLPAIYPFSLLRREWRLGLLWFQYGRATSGRSLLCRPYTEGRKTGRPTCASANEVRPRNQPQDSEGVGPERLAATAAARRRGDRIGLVDVRLWHLADIGLCTAHVRF